MILDNEILLTFYPNVENSWDEMIKTIKKEYKINNIFYFNYEKNNWLEFFFKFYNISNKFIDLKNLSYDNNILYKVEDYLEKNNKKQLRNFKEILKKGIHIDNSYKDKKFLCIVVEIKKSQYRDLMNLKNKIRNKECSKNKKTERWCIIHSFLLGENSNNAHEFIKSNCTVYQY